MDEKYTVRQIFPFSVRGLIQIERLLYECGKNMAEMDDLHHWDNSHFKNALIVCLCALKNKLYLVFDGSTPVATFQTKIIKEKLRFQKLATKPKMCKRGIGTFCMIEIESYAQKHGCVAVYCEVYDKSLRAKEFYLHRGYSVIGKEDTLKYSELIMEKVL